VFIQQCLVVFASFSLLQVFPGQLGRLVVRAFPDRLETLDLLDSKVVQVRLDSRAQLELLGQPERRALLVLLVALVDLVRKLFLAALIIQLYIIALKSVIVLV